MTSDRKISLPTVPAEPFSLLNPTGKREVTTEDLKSFYEPGNDGEPAFLSGWGGLAKDKELIIYVPTSGHVLDGLAPELQAYSEFNKKYLAPMLNMFAEGHADFAPASSDLLKAVTKMVEQKNKEGFKLRLQTGPADQAPKENVLFIAPMKGPDSDGSDPGGLGPEEFIGIATFPPGLSDEARIGYFSPIAFDLWRKAFAKPEGERDGDEKKRAVRWEKYNSVFENSVILDDIRLKREEAKSSSSPGRDAITDKKIVDAYRLVYGDEAKPSEDIIKEYDQRLASGQITMADFERFFVLSYDKKSMLMISQDGVLGNLMKKDPHAGARVFNHEVAHSLLGGRHPGDFARTIRLANGSTQSVGLTDLGFTTYAIKNKSGVNIDHYTITAPWADLQAAPNPPFQSNILDEMLRRDALGIKPVSEKTEDQAVFDMDHIYPPGTVENMQKNSYGLPKKEFESVTLQAVTVDGSLGKKSETKLPSIAGSVNTFDNNAGQVSWIAQNAKTEERFRQYVFVQEPVGKIVCPTSTTNLVVSSRAKKEEIEIGSESNTTLRLPAANIPDKVIKNQCGHLTVEIPLSAISNPSFEFQDNDVVFNLGNGSKITLDTWLGQDTSIVITNDKGKPLFSQNMKNYSDLQDWARDFITPLNKHLEREPKPGVKQALSPSGRPELSL